MENLTEIMEWHQKYELYCISCRSRLEQACRCWYHEIYIVGDVECYNEQCELSSYYRRPKKFDQAITFIKSILRY